MDQTVEADPTFPILTSCKLAQQTSNTRMLRLCYCPGSNTSSWDYCWRSSLEPSWGCSTLLYLALLLFLSFISTKDELKLNVFTGVDADMSQPAKIVNVRRNRIVSSPVKLINLQSTAMEILTFFSTSEMLFDFKCKAAFFLPKEFFSSFLLSLIIFYLKKYIYEK